MAGNRIRATSSSTAMMLSAMLVVATTMSSTYRGTAIAQTTGGNDGAVATCGAGLIPCGKYLNTTTTPPSSCCDPLKQTITTQKTCLCSILNDTSLLTSLGINVTQAFTIPTRCGITTASDANICATGASPASAPPSPTGKSTADRISATGISPFLALSMPFLILFY